MWAGLHRVLVPKEFFFSCCKHSPKYVGLYVCVLYRPAARQTDDSKPFASQQPEYMAPVVSHSNETRKAEKELVVLGLVTSAS